MTIKGNFFSHVVTHTNDALQALLAPAKTIATNAGVDGAVVVFDLVTGELVTMQ
jgi:chaperonin GroEL (HSP60 family)